MASNTRWKIVHFKYISNIFVLYSDIISVKKPQDCKDCFVLLMYVYVKQAKPRNLYALKSEPRFFLKAKAVAVAKARTKETLWL